MEPLAAAAATAAAASSVSVAADAQLGAPPLLPSGPQSVGLYWTYGHQKVQPSSTLEPRVSVYLLMNHHRTAGTLLTIMTNDWTALDFDSPTTQHTLAVGRF